MQVNSRLNLILALVIMSLGGLLLHWRIHPLFVSNQLVWERLIPVVFGSLSIVIIPWLFSKEITADLAYLLTGLSVAFGIITMSHLSIATWQGNISLFKILLNTTLPDSLILFSKFMIAKAIFESYYPERAELNCKFPQTLRFLFDGWWFIHFIAIAAIYSLGVILF